MTRTCRQVPASPAAYLAQDGWIDERVVIVDDELVTTRRPKMVEVTHAFEPGPCRYDAQHIDKECAGCPRRDKGEAA